MSTQLRDREFSGNPTSLAIASSLCNRLFLLLLVLCACAAYVPAQQPEEPLRFKQEIIGVRDNRTNVAYTSKFPFSAIGRVEGTFPDGHKTWGSGALIGPDKVITAEHVVFDPKHGGHASVVFYPGYSNGVSICKPTVVIQIRHGAHQGCHSGADCDVAILTTRERIGCDTGWFGFKEYSESDLGDVFIAGYPEDLAGGEKLYFVRTRASHVHNSGVHNRLSYRDWTAGGMSGGPIFTADYFIIGIHTMGAFEANYGIALCNQMFSSVHSWAFQ